MTLQIDDTDAALLNALRENARAPVAALARKLGIARTTVQARIDRLEASGGVTLVSGEEAAEADQADYDIDAGTVEMTGNVLLTQGQNALTSERMVVDLDTGTAQMAGRVRTVLQPGEGNGTGGGSQ